MSDEYLQPGKRPSAFSAFRHRDYTLYWWGMCVSTVGTWMQAVGQSWLVLELTDSAFLLGLQTALQNLPAAVLSLPAGCMADRVSKRRIVVASQVVMMVCAFLLSAVTRAGLVEYWHVAVLSLVTGAATAFDVTVRQALMVQMVGHEDLMSAISLNSAMFNVARTFGPALAGWVLASYGAATTFFVNGVSFLAIIWALLLMRISEPPRAAGGESGFSTLKRDILEGFQFIRANPVPLFAMVSLFLVSAFAFNYQVLTPILARQVLGQGAAGYGMLMSAFGIGALVSALIMSYLSHRGPMPSLIIAGSFMTPLVVGVLAVVRVLWVAMILMAAYGWWVIAFISNANSLLQYNTPDHLRGRVMGIYSLVLLGSAPVGALYVGAASGLLGGRAGCLATALGGLAAALALEVWVRKRQVFATAEGEGFLLPSAPEIVRPGQGHADDLADGHR